MTDSPPPGADFPTYASLTQTTGWGDTAAPVDGRMQAVEIQRDGARYVEGALLGAGGMGKVMLARDERIGRDVAVKELHTRAMTHEEHARFLREARVQGQLEHPSIVPVYDIDRRPDGTVFFTMRRVVGKTLHAILDDVRRVAPGARTQHELLTAFATVCLALEYAHSRGVVHRDLKPANLMLGEFGEVYVLDWGLARLVNDSVITDGPAPRLSIPGELMGTPMYMAPEQMADPEVGQAADIYALGAILFEILALTPLRDPRAPFVPADARPSLRTPDRGVAPELEAICVTATAAEPADRFPSARALHDAVIRYLEGDRDRELRQARAATHARVARAALTRADQADASYEAERDIAMLETVRALAYDPSNAELVGMLGEILEKPPRVVPPEVEQQLRADSNRTIGLFAKSMAPTLGSWLLFVPPFALIGFYDISLLWPIMIPLFLAMVSGLITTITKSVSAFAQLTNLVLVMVALASVTWIYGPLILTPTMVATCAIVLQVFPSRMMRRLSVGLAIVISIGLVVLELSGVLTSYAFEGGRWMVLPQLIELPRTGTLLLLLVINVATMILPCLFIAHLRGALSRAQRHQLLQAWHFRRLGDQLMRARA